MMPKRQPEPGDHRCSSMAISSKKQRFDAVQGDTDHSLHCSKRKIPQMRKLISVLLIFCMIGAWGSIAYRNISVPNEYENNYARAREAFDKGYYVETLSWLNAAEEIESNYETDCLRRDTYRNMGEAESYIGECQRLIGSYPEDVENYIAVLEYYSANENYGKLLQLLPVYLERFPENEQMKELLEEIRHSWRYVQTGYYDVQYATPSLLKIRYTEWAEDGEERYPEYVLTDNDGRKIFSYGYQDIAVSQDGGSAMVCDQNGVWTRVTADNQLLAKNDEVTFEKMGSLSASGIATAVIDGKYRFVNGELKIAAPKWEDAATFSEGINAVSRDGKWAVVNQDSWGEAEEYLYADVARNRYDLCSTGGRIVVADSQGYFLLDTELIPVFDRRYEEIKAFESEEPTAYRENGQWGFLNTAGESVIAPQYEDAQSFANGYAAVKQNGLWGYLDLRGDMIVEPQFEECLPVRKNGIAYVKNEEGYWDYVIFDMLYYQS